MSRWMVIAAGLFAAWPAQAQQAQDRTAGRIRWRSGSEYEQGLAEARERGLPILLFFKQTW